ncbi:hypothetical protein D3C76_1738910 [compost metagenome]
MLERQDDDLVSAALFTDLRLSDLPVFTNVQVDEVGRLLPSQIRELKNTIRERNPDFFEMLARLGSSQARP